MGRNTSISSAMPMKQPPRENMNIRTGIIKVSRPAIRFITDPIATVIAPVASKTLKAPPIIRRKNIIYPASSIPLGNDLKTLKRSTGDCSIVWNESATTTILPVSAFSTLLNSPAGRTYVQTAAIRIRANNSESGSSIENFLVFCMVTLLCIFNEAVFGSMISITIFVEFFYSEIDRFYKNIDIT